VKLHEFAVALRVLYGVELPGFKYDKLRELARFMERMSGVPLQQHEPIVGSKVFAHESGIHTQAMLIDHRMYEAVPGELVGGRTSWVFGKHTGASLVEDTLRRQRDRLIRAGVEPTTELAHRVTDEIKRLREERAASSKSEETIELYETAMRRLSISESDVIEIAIALDSPQPAAAS
jgi:isopropylmalate/homocitrate/citramalate synthase